MSPVRAAQPARQTVDGIAHDRILAPLHLRHVDADRAVDGHPVVAAAARDMGSPRARDQRFGRDAAVVDAGAAERTCARRAHVLRPLWARRTASGGPAWPAPMTMASKRSDMVRRRESGCRLPSGAGMSSHSELRCGRRHRFFDGPRGAKRSLLGEGHASAPCLGWASDRGALSMMRSSSRTRRATSFCPRR